MVICKERGADCLQLYIYQVMLLPFPKSVISCLIRIQTGFTFLVLAYLSCPRKEAVKCV